MSKSLKTWLCRLPKAELHLHIDGTMQAHRLLALAEKNEVRLPYATVEEVEAAYQFDNLQSFLDLYYLGASVLLEEDDFYHLMMDYLLMCKQQNIVHAEIMVEPQTYQPNGVAFATMMAGFNRAMAEAQASWGQSTLLILSFLRHLSEAEALHTLHEAEPFKEQFIAVGLASSELGNPPQKFARLFAQARNQGYRTVAHAGEEGPPSYIWQSLDVLQTERVDHGVRCIEDADLVQRLISSQTALTVCPLSNVKLRVFDELRQHNLLELLEQGLCVTVNSDDPAYFGGYLNENLCALVDSLSMTQAQAMKLIENSFNASFMDEFNKQRCLELLKQA